MLDFMNAKRTRRCSSSHSQDPSQREERKDAEADERKRKMQKAQKRKAEE